MSGPSVQLYETATGVVNAAGGVSLTFNGPKLGRTWQGTVSILGAPVAQAFTLSVGAQAFGIVYAPGPCGPYQMLHGQAISLVATSGLTVGSTITLILSGVDDPSEKATPYTGPTSATAAAVATPAGAP